MSNRWIDFVREYALKHNMAFGCAINHAGTEYHKKYGKYKKLTQHNERNLMENEDFSVFIKAPEPVKHNFEILEHEENEMMGQEDINRATKKTKLDLKFELIPDKKLKKYIRSAWKLMVGSQIKANNKKKLDDMEGKEFLKYFRKNISEKEGREGLPIWKFNTEFNPDKLEAFILDEINKEKQPKKTYKQGEQLVSPFQKFSMGQEVLYHHGHLGKIVNQTATGLTIKTDEYDKGEFTDRGYRIYYKKTFNGELKRLGNNSEIKKIPPKYNYTYWISSDMQA